jgi:hypothetical protein
MPDILRGWPWLEVLSLPGVQFRRAAMPIEGRAVYAATGQVLKASLVDFLMPYATEVPRPELHHIETSCSRWRLALTKEGHRWR